MEKYRLEGLDCADCATKLEKYLLKKDYVNEVSISFTTKTMIISTSDIEKVKEDIRYIEPDVSVLEANKSKADIDADHELATLDKERMLIIISLCLFVVAFVVELLQKFRYVDYELYYFFIPVYIFAYLVIGLPILIGAYNCVTKKDFFDEKVLMSISTIAAFLIGSFEEACGVMLFYAIGEYFQNIAIINSRKDIKNLLELKEKTANVILNETETYEEVKIEDVKKDSYILVKPGEKVPLDGIVVKGSGEFNLSALTGESMPKHIDIGQEVYAGAINMNSKIILKVTNTYEDSSMFKLVELIESSMHKKTKADKFITKFSNWYTPSIIVLAILVAILPPLFLKNVTFERSIYSSIVLLVISCPCALVLSIPLTYFTGVGALAKKGILVKAINTFDTIEKVDTVFLDKTGTITEGKFHVSEVNEYYDNVRDLEEREIFEHIYIAENNSNHPIAKSIIEFIKAKYGLTKVQYDDVYMEFISYCKHCGCCHKPKDHSKNNDNAMYVDEYRHRIGHSEEDLCNNHEFSLNAGTEDKTFGKDIKVIELSEIAGQGIKLKTDKYLVLVGNDNMMKKNKVNIPESAKNIKDEYGTNINVAFNGQYVLNIYVKDKIKKDTKEAIKCMRQVGIKNIAMLTGDNRLSALEVKNTLAIDDCYYNLLPKDKLRILEEKRLVDKIMYLGDGINDAPVIAAADVGVAMGRVGSDVAIGASDIVFNTDTLMNVSLLKKKAKKMKYIVLENIVIILLVKFIVIILGVLGLAGLWGAVFGDVGVALVAILNSKRIKKNSPNF
ncbi:heavy metal translocating P-type ATPase [Sneathia sp. DSM 16630]|nr:heavy metal translocating P-type ATPase [Sneathia sp. DSM 16630]